MATSKLNRDTQRSKVYEWENETFPALYRKPEFTLEEARAWLAPIWIAERARVGLGNVPVPMIERPHRGQRRALAYTKEHRITLPVWARSKWLVLHEASHLLTPGDRHGPRFVGELIGLACRYLDMDASQLMRSCDERGVKYSLRTIGKVPVHGAAWHIDQAIRREPMSEMDLCCHLSLDLGLDYKPAQVRGGALALVRQGRARWHRKKLRAITPVLEAGDSAIQDEYARAA